MEIPGKTVKKRQFTLPGPVIPGSFQSSAISRDLSPRKNCLYSRAQLMLQFMELADLLFVQVAEVHHIQAIQFLYFFC